MAALATALKPHRRRDCGEGGMMKFKVTSMADLSEGEISTLVDWQVYEMLKGKACSVCGQGFASKTQLDNAIYIGNDGAGETMAAHEYCYNRN